MVFTALKGVYRCNGPVVFGIIPIAVGLKSMAFGLDSARESLRRDPDTPLTPAVMGAGAFAGGLIMTACTLLTLGVCIGGGLARNRALREYQKRRQEDSGTNINTSNELQGNGLEVNPTKAHGTSEKMD